MHIRYRYFFFKNLNLLGSKSSLKARLFKFSITYIPFVRNKFNKEIEKAITSFNNDMTKLFDKKIYKIPNKKVGLDSLKERALHI